MVVNVPVTTLPGPHLTGPRYDDIAFIVGRMTAALDDVRNTNASEQVQLHDVCSAAVMTTIEIVNRYATSVPFDVKDGIGELREALLDVIEAEYRRILEPEQTAGLVETLTLATGGLMLRAACGLLEPNPDDAVDAQLAALLRFVA